MAWTKPRKIVSAHETVTNTSITDVIINDRKWSINSRTFYGRNEVQVRLGLSRDDDERECERRSNAVLWLPRDEQLEVVVRATKPWDGLKVGDVLASDTHWFIVISMPEGKEPWLMALERMSSGDETADRHGVGYCGWTWYEQKNGPMRPVFAFPEAAAKKVGVLGLDFYQGALRALGRD